MTVNYLYSNSEGNSTLVNIDNFNIILDIGVSFKKLTASFDKLPKIDIVLITHEHGDHIAGAGILGRKTGATIFMPEACYEQSKKLFKNCKIVFIEGGYELEFDKFMIKSFSTRHDSKASLGYSITELSTNKTYTHVTDTGVVTPVIKSFIDLADGLFIESDYDLHLLDAYKEYDDFLKARISSYTGHLSNQQVIRLLQTINNKEWIVLGHLSKKTNSVNTVQYLINKHLNKDLMEKISIFNEEKIIRTL